MRSLKPSPVCITERSRLCDAASLQKTDEMVRCDESGGTRLCSLPDILLRECTGNNNRCHLGSSCSFMGDVLVVVLWGLPKAWEVGPC
jgi:hypothetical protein